MLAPWALETCSVKDCRANARKDGRFQKGMIFPCRRCRKEVLGETVGIISLAFLTGWHSARCRNPFFARDGEWHDAKMGFGNIPKRIDEANYNLWWGFAPRNDNAHAWKWIFSRHCECNEAILFRSKNKSKYFFCSLRWTLKALEKSITSQSGRILYIIP